MTEAVPRLVLANATKSFGAVTALGDGSITLYPGEAHALVGENGAGKSTLVKILGGVYFPDTGTLTIDGTPTTFAGPADAQAAGVAIIYQEPSLFPDLTVAENIFMGRQPVRAGRRIDRAAMAREAREIFTRLGVHLDPARPARGLSVADQQIVEIAKALSLNAQVLVMDEPTAALTPVEVLRLFDVMATLRKSGAAVLFISHRLEEVFAACQRVTIMRDGRFVRSAAVEELTIDDIIRSMVGRDLDALFPKSEIAPGAVVLEVRGLTREGVFADVSFDVRAGEIVALAGLVGAGRSEAMQAVFGLSRPDTGEILVRGKARAIKSPADAIAAGIAYVPEDRQSQGAVLPFGVRENTTLASLIRHARFGFLSQRSEIADTRRLGTRLAVKAASWDQKLQELSGGNQQKVVIAKWLATNPKVIILDEPTKGIDVGSKAAVHDFMVDLAAEGLAVVLISSELPEVMGMSDRILVMHEGRIVKEFARTEMDAAAIVTAATGGHA